MADGVLMTWGDIRFEVSWGGYQEMQRTSAYKYAANPRVGKSDERQFTGKGDDVMTLRGIMYPIFRGRAQNIDTIRTEAEKGEDRQLTSGLGDVLGAWVCTNISETHSNLEANGVAKKIAFEITFMFSE